MYRPVLRTPILNIDTRMNEIRIANNRVSVQCTSINRFDFLPPLRFQCLYISYWRRLLIEKSTAGYRDFFNGNGVSFWPACIPEHAFVNFGAWQCASYIGSNYLQAPIRSLPFRILNFMSSSESVEKTFKKFFSCSVWSEVGLNS